ncbi:hypothetical protein MTO96_041275 [Rhipicephalus appendiculatus]
MIWLNDLPDRWLAKANTFSGQAASSLVAPNCFMKRTNSKPKHVDGMQIRNAPAAMAAGTFQQRSMFASASACSLSELG